MNTVSIFRLPTCPRRTRAPRAFTLIELLVVIAIIGILAAILFPVFGRVRESGRAAACSSNMKQLGLAFQQYMADSGGRYPGGGQYQKWGNGGHWVSGPNSTNNGGDGAALAEVKGAGNPDDGNPTGRSADIQNGALYKYVNNAQVYVCPSNAGGNVKKLTYSMNCAIAGITEARVKSPSEMVLLLDEDKANDGFIYAADIAGSTDELTQIHNGGGNILFCDGHVKRFQFDAFPIDGSATGRANKTRIEGAPRFYDKALGALGFYDSGPTFGSCADPCGKASGGTNCG